MRPETLLIGLLYGLTKLSFIVWGYAVIYAGNLRAGLDIRRYRP